MYFFYNKIFNKSFAKYFIYGILDGENKRKGENFIMKKLKPKCVDNDKMYTREEATRAMGISTVSFSKYFALGGHDHKKYRGVYLNQRIDEITDAADDEDKVRIINFLPDKHAKKVKERETIVHGYKVGHDVAYLKKPTEDGYIAGIEPISTIVEATKREGVFFKYLLPLTKIWMNEKVKPDIVLVDIEAWSSLEAKSEQYSMYQYELLKPARENGYRVGQINDLMTNKLTILDKNSKDHNLLYIPAVCTHGYMNDVLSMVNAGGIVGIFDMLFTTRYAGQKRPLKIVINDISTNVMENNAMYEMMTTICSIGAGLGIEVTIATDKKLDSFEKMCHVVKGVKEWKFDADFAQVIEK